MFWRAVRVRSNKAARKPHSLRAALEVIHPLLIPTLKARHATMPPPPSPSRVYHSGVNSRELLIPGVVTISKNSTTELIPGNYPANGKENNEFPVQRLTGAPPAQDRADGAAGGQL